MKAKVYAVVAEGLEEVECLAAVDVMIRCGIEVKLISMSGSLEVAGSHGLRIVTDMLWEGFLMLCLRDVIWRLGKE